MKIVFTLLLLFTIVFVNAQNSPCDSIYKKSAGAFAADTTIILENGTIITFNRCDFFEIRNCISFKEIRTTEDARAAGLTTMDNQGNVLLSCGMFILDMETGNCNIQCLNNPVKIKIPVLQNKCAGSTAPIILYTANAKGLWQPSKIVSKISSYANGKEYFEFETKCAGKFNCDRKMSTVSVKFKAKHATALEKIEATAKCPILNIAFSAKKHRKKIIIAKLPCINPDSLQITATVLNNGSTAFITKPLSSFKTSFKKTGCSQISMHVVRRLLGVFKWRQRNVYGKYIIQ